MVFSFWKHVLLDPELESFLSWHDASFKVTYSAPGAVMYTDELASIFEASAAFDFDYFLIMG